MRQTRHATRHYQHHRRRLTLAGITQAESPSWGWTGAG
jgi:hypothetical protein